MKRQNLLKKISLALLVGTALCGCTEDIDTSARYVFKYDTILSYLEAHEEYSAYVDMLKRVAISNVSDGSVSQLMSARGNYTCFAPNNEAVDKFLRELYLEEPDLMSGPSFEEFYLERKRDSIQRIIVHNSIIDSELGAPYEEANFPSQDKAEFPIANMNSHKLSIHRVADPDSIYINGCPVSILQRDIRCLNGMIHQMEAVIAPKDYSASKYISDALDRGKKGYLVAFKAIQACGLMDTLSKVRDEVYEQLYLTNKIPELHDLGAMGFGSGGNAYPPEHRLIGFTLFLETDEFWESQGLDPTAPSAELLPQLVQWIVDHKQYSETYDRFVTDDNYSSPRNLLYQWITYHMLPMRLAPDHLVIHHNEFGYNIDNPYVYSIPVYEYFTTMGHRRMLKLIETHVSDGVCLNRFPQTDNRRDGTGKEIGCDEDKRGIHVGNDDARAITADIINACIYPLDQPLAYTDKVRNCLGQERIRFDAMSMLPESMTNDIRKKKVVGGRFENVTVPDDHIYPYFENMRINEGTAFLYHNAYRYEWGNLNADEMKALGRYEILLTLPPVPRKGIYEMRYKILATDIRGIAQIYLGTDPENLPVSGIPINLTLNAEKDKDRRLMGFEDDTEDMEYNILVDKNMRNNGYMKGSKSICRAGRASQPERILGFGEGAKVRIIIARQEFDPDKTYYLKVKSVLDSDRREFYMDYLEYCPKEIYDNPATPEDIW